MGRADKQRGPDTGRESSVGGVSAGGRRGGVKRAGVNDGHGEGKGGRWVVGWLAEGGASGMCMSVGGAGG